MATKTVRLRNTGTGVVVRTSADNAERLSGFEPAPKSNASDSKSSK